jgi:hypothetical protein
MNIPTKKSDNTAVTLVKKNHRTDSYRSITEAEDRSPSILFENRLDPNETSVEETMSEVLQSKREQFLLQFSINLLNEEIQKLENIISDKKESIADSEHLLAYNIENIVKIAKESDQKAQEVINDVPIVTQRRVEKLKEVRSLNIQILKTLGSIRERTRILEESLRFSNFLSSLTPIEWVTNRNQDKKERQNKRRYERIIKRQEGWRIENAKNVSLLTVKFEQDLKSIAKVRRNRGKQDMNREKYLAELEKLNKEVPPSCEDEPITSSDDELPMYFTKPEQLMESIALLEKENVLLIQNLQASEETAKVLQVACEETVSSIDSELQRLRFTIQMQKENIAKAESIEIGTQLSCTKILDSETDRAIEILRKSMKQLCVECGIHYNNPISSLQSMLMVIETRQDQILASLSAMPAEHVKKSEKEREKKRKEWKRIQNQKQQRRAQEEKNKKYLERSLQPPRKKIGPPVSTCSKYCIGKSFPVIKNILNFLFASPFDDDIFSDNVSLCVT